MHHVISKFLGGHADGFLKKLSQHTHRECHVLLARRLTWDFGPDTPVTAKFWAKKMASMSPGQLQRLRRALYETCQTIEQSHADAAGLTRDLLREIRRQKF